MTYSIPYNFLKPLRCLIVGVVLCVGLLPGLSIAQLDWKGKWDQVVKSAIQEGSVVVAGA